jgi:peptidoglycan/LPS O-acetylase OafA/YrhL
VSGLIALTGYAAALSVPLSFKFAACTIIGFTLLIPAVAKFDLSERKSILGGRVMVRLGELSFAFYMIHVLVLLTVRVFIGVPRLPVFPGLALTAGVFAIALGAAWLLNVFVENPGEGSYFASRSASAPRATPTP